MDKFWAAALASPSWLNGTQFVNCWPEQQLLPGRLAVSASSRYKNLGKIKTLLSFQGLKVKGLPASCFRACHYFPSVEEWQCKGPFAMRLLPCMVTGSRGQGLMVWRVQRLVRIASAGMGCPWCNSYDSNTVDPSSNFIAEMRKSIQMNLTHPS